MSKQLVARALAELSDSRVLIRYKIIDEPIATLIRAVDAQYGTKYDEQDGFLRGLTNTPYPSDFCTSCYAERQDGHAPDCRRWNTRVALLALCRDILGEKG